MQPFMQHTLYGTVIHFIVKVYEAPGVNGSILVSVFQI